MIIDNILIYKLKKFKIFSKFMKEENISKIKKEIKGGGIPLQIYSSVILDKLNWNVKQNCFYNLFNKKGESEREIDILGEKGSFIPRLNNIIIFECKKSSNPWVFFKQKTKMGKDPFLVTALVKDNIFIYDFVSKNFEKFHYLGKEIHTYFHTAFFKEKAERESQYSPIHKAIKQVLSGMGFIANQNEDFLRKNPLAIDGYFLYPLIVLDGELLSALNREDGEIEIEERNHIALQLNFEMEEAWIVPGKQGSQGLRSKKIIVDVVKKEYLEEFLRNSFP